MIPIPADRSYYYPRGSFGALFLQYFRYGYWKLAVMRKHRALISGRSVVPAAFVLLLLGLAVAATVSSVARIALAAIVPPHRGSPPWRSASRPSDAVV